MRSQEEFKKIELWTKIVFTCFISFLVIFFPYHNQYSWEMLISLLLLDGACWNILSFSFEFLDGKRSWPRFAELLKRYANLRFDKFWAIIPALVTVLIIIFLWVYFAGELGNIYTKLNPLVALFLFVSSLFMPIFEEYMFRKLLLDDFLLRIGKDLNNTLRSQLFSQLWLLSALLLQSYLFVHLHGDSLDWSGFAFWSRFTLGLFCGILYIKSDRNLLPGLSSHLTYNAISSGVLIVKSLV